MLILRKLFVEGDLRWLLAMKVSGFTCDENKRWSSISGVNVTLGLPIIRTSVDHGVAFGKAGEGRANPQSMIQAINLAARLAKSG